MNKKQILITFIMLIIIAIIGGFGCNIVQANKIKEYELQIVENNAKIDNATKIKQQLHITAEMLRKENVINNGFDMQLGQKWQEYDRKQKELEAQNVELSKKIEVEKTKRIFVGNFKLTHYCPCGTCNGGYGNKTATGTVITPYRTIAVDPKVIPLGSKVEILGEEYIAEDTGRAIKGNKIDICVGSHAEAYRRGVMKNVPVYIIKD